MKTKKLRLTGALAILLMLSLVLAACGGNSGGANSTTSSNTGSTPEQTTNAEQPEEPARDEYTAVMAVPVFGSDPKDMELVSTEINKLVKEKLNTTIDFQLIPFGNWDQKTNLMLSSGEKLDLFVTFGGIGYTAQAAAGKIVPLNELLESHGQGIINAVGEDYLSATKIEGQSYAVPTIREFAQNYQYVMRKDLVDKHNIDIAAIKTMADVENVLKLIKENEPDIVPLATNGSAGPLTNFPFGDNLGDSLGVLMNHEELTVENVYESEAYRQALQTTHAWYKAGYILRDAATNQLPASQVVKAGKAFSFMHPGKPGFAEQETRTIGMDMVTVELIEPLSTTSSVTGVMWSIAQNAEDKARAMEVLNLFYSDPQVLNLINHGIEGTHYQIIGDNMIDFAEGVTGDTSGYFPNWDWLTGNSFLSYTFKGGDPELAQKTAAFNDSARKSKALGFNFNVEPVKQEVTALNNVREKYVKGLETGTLDPENLLAQFNNELKAAGLDKVIEEKQRQLTEWAEQNNVQ